jgi:hypothetical protein
MKKRHNYYNVAGLVWMNILIDRICKWKLLSTTSTASVYEWNISHESKLPCAPSQCCNTPCSLGIIDSNTFSVEYCIYRVSRCRGRHNRQYTLHYMNRVCNFKSFPSFSFFSKVLDGSLLSQIFNSKNETMKHVHVKQQIYF